MPLLRRPSRVGAKVKIQVAASSVTGYLNVSADDQRGVVFQVFAPRAVALESLALFLTAKAGKP